MIDVWIARTFSVIGALLILFLAGAGAAVFREYYRRWRAGVDAKFDTQAWTAQIVMIALCVILFAVLDIGQALVLVTEGWGAIVGIIGTLLLPILGYKSVQAVQATKGGPSNVTGGTL